MGIATGEKEDNRDYSMYIIVVMHNYTQLRSYTCICETDWDSYYMIVYSYYCSHTYIYLWDWSKFC